MEFNVRAPFSYPLNFNMINHCVNKGPTHFPYDTLETFFQLEAGRKIDMDMELTQTAKKLQHAGTCLN